MADAPRTAAAGTAAGSIERCPSCAYDLSGRSSERCPECGAEISAARAAAARRALRRRRIWSAAMVLFVAYAPYAWILFVDEPWNAYRRLWLARWPIMPMMLGTHILLPATPNWAKLAAAGAGTALILALAIALAWRSGRWLAGVATVVLGLSALNALGLYAAFRM
ncbi:MAG: hypothetical protein KDA22_16735 [Phycisphaerales bacterium]|nr:hypothetical protein [Phycisphaerales bacterium]